MRPSLLATIEYLRVCSYISTIFDLSTVDSQTMVHYKASTNRGIVLGTSPQPALCISTPQLVLTQLQATEMVAITFTHAATVSRCQSVAQSIAQLRPCVMVSQLFPNASSEDEGECEEEEETARVLSRKKRRA
jgi:hypothetical protein